VPTPAAAPTPAAPAPAAPPAPPVEEVAVRIVTTPAGATVLRDRRVVGTTPLILSLRRGDPPIAIEIRRSGFVPVTRALLADAPGDIVIPLRRRPSELVRPKVKL
jgi:hypothetical protein